MGNFHNLPAVPRKSKTVQGAVPQIGTGRINVTA